MEKFHLPWVVWVPGLIVVAVLAFEFIQLRQARRALERAIENERAQQARQLAEARKDAPGMEAAFLKEQAELDARHRAQLQDSNLISGKLAAQRHVEEWKRRQNHDPNLAESWLEKSMVEAEKLGRNSEIASEVALKHVAEMVSPEGSRVEVKPNGDRFEVRVAFKLSAVMPDEAGSATRHTNSMAMRKEIEDVTARVVKALFDFCGSRGIQSLSVSCNRALAEGASGQEHLVMRSLYRVSLNAEQAATVASWRTIPLAQVARLWKVERDTIAHVTFSAGVRSNLRLDPDEPLEF